MRKGLFVLAMAFVAISVSAVEVDVDSMRVMEVDGVQVRASSRETTAATKIPSAATNISLARIEALAIDNIKSLSTLAPNLFVADYGSPLSTPIYIRGVGTRGSGQSVSVYIDGVPILDKSVFDMERLGISHIEILRGPQGTLYGRNAMGGVINIQTRSPLDYQGTKIRAGAASYGTYNIDAATTFKVSPKIGIGLSGYARMTDGYFKNVYTNRSVDRRQDMGASARFDWEFAPLWRAELALSYDYTSGGAFAYGLYDKQTGGISPVNYNDRGSYDRNSSINSLRFTRNGEKVLFSSTTSYQYLSDNMWMDQDFTPASIFTINQRQRQHAVSQELIFRSADQANYQWSVGAFGFYNDLNTIGDVKFGEDGVKRVLQPVFDGISNKPGAPTMTITDKSIPNPGTYKTPSWGAALFHQSTFNNLITEGLSLTVGMRFDYERQYINYNTSLAMNLNVKMGNRPEVPMKVDTTLNGGTNQGFFEWLPKISLRYECTPNISTWITASKGYKAGGYNVQMFSEVIQRAIQEKYNPKAEKLDMQSMIAYRPEVTWNYEIGARADMFDRLWSMEFAAFYMDISNVQITRFVEGGSGRMLSNAGHGQSCGVEFSSTVRPLVDRRMLRFDVNYGFTRATFLNYNDGRNDYKGKYIPYTPQHTFAISGIYNMPIRGSWLTGVEFVLSYNGAGKIYWTEANDTAQDFYGLLDARVAIQSKVVSLELWAKNILDTKYGAFYFESFSQAYVQQGRPMTFGADLVIKF